MQKWGRHLHGSPSKAKKVKMKYEEEEGGCHMKIETYIWWPPHHRSTYLQKCHSGQQNYKSTTMGQNAGPFT